MDVICCLFELECCIVLCFIWDYEVNLLFFCKISCCFFSGVNVEGCYVVLEYNMDFGEVMMGVDFENVFDDNFIYFYELIFYVLLFYICVIFFVFEIVLLKIRVCFKMLGLSKWVCFVVSKDWVMCSFGEGVICWVCDFGFVVNDGKYVFLFIFLVYKYFFDVFYNDLVYFVWIDDLSYYVR